jgi:hypothetical protein
MYEEIGIDKLSDSQRKNLIKGKAIRVKSGNSHYIYLTREQLKNVNKAFKHGKAVTIKFDKEQVEKHGSGLFGDIAKFVKKHSLQKLVNPVIRGVKQASHSGVSRASNFLHSKIDKLKPIEGEGILSDILGAVSQGTSMFGLGVARKKMDKVSKPRAVKPKAVKPKAVKPKGVKRGKGFLTNLVKSIASSDTAKNIIKDVVNKGVDVGIKSLTGGQVKRRGRPRKIVGSALMPAGY